MDVKINRRSSQRTDFLKVFASIFLTLSLIVTALIVFFYQIKEHGMMNKLNVLDAFAVHDIVVEPLMILWLFFCSGIAICSYLLAGYFMHRIHGEQELVKYWDESQELVEARTHELKRANKLLQRSEERAHLVKEIASAANLDNNTEDVLFVAIRSIAKNMQWPIGHVYVSSPDNPSEMISTSMWHLEEPTAYQEFINLTESLRYGLGVGLPGMVLLKKEAILVEDFTKSVNFPRAAVALSSGINAGFAFPVFVHGQVVAVLEFFAHKMEQLGEDVLSFAEQIGEQLGSLMERKKETEALRIEQEKAQRYLNIAGSVIVVIGADENIKLINKAGLGILGYSENELIGKNWFEHVIPQENRVVKRRVFRQVINQEIEITEFYESLICLKDGTERLMSWHSVIIYDKRGCPIEVLISGEDITEYRKVNKELRKLSQAVEQSPVSVVITDRQGSIQYVNAKFCEKTHYRREEALGQNPRILKSGSLPCSFYQELWQTILAGNIWRGDFLNKTKYGDQYWERASISSIMDDTGEIVNFIAIKEDITAQKQMQEELLQAKVEAELSNKAKGDFLANMSHEIRTPMNAVIGLTHLALQTDLTPKQLDYLQKISVSAHSLMGTINDILDFSRFSSGKLTMECIEFNLWKLLEDVIAILNSKVEEKGLEMVFNVAKTVPMRLKGDPHRLQQILLNLLSNALKFTNQGEIVLTVKLITRQSNCVQLEFAVRDTGIGMNEQEKGRLFNPFTQADGSTTRKYGGTGLGLVISKQLVEMMGGAIHVKSSPGWGSQFIFTVKFDSYEQEQCSSPNNFGKLQVLVIDDNESSCLALKEILETLRFRVSFVTSGEEGIAQLLLGQKEEPFDLIVLDWVMPGMDGLTTARLIRNQLAGLSIPIIMVTPYRDDNHKKQALDLNATDFLVKPITPDLLFNAIMEIFGKGQRQILRSIPRLVSSYEKWNDLRGARILLVEDNEINLQVAREIMEDINIVVTVARNGREAVSLVQQKAFDAVLMDIQMPEMDGLEATRLIRSNQTFSQLPILAMTADVVNLRIQEYLAAGMNDFIFKPIDIEQMFNSLSKWVKPQLMTLDFAGKPEFQNVKQEAGADLSILSGINVESGLARVGGNKNLYHELLVQFLKSNEGFVDILQMALQKGDDALVRMSLHTLKGVAGTIGADDLYVAVGNLEVSITEDQAKQIPLQMSVFSRILLEVLDSIRDFTERAAEVKVPQHVGIETQSRDERKESKELIERLERYLANYDTEAAGVFDQLKALPVSAQYQAQFKKIQIAMSSYEFEIALEQLTEIRKSMQ